VDLVKFTEPGRYQSELEDANRMTDIMTHAQGTLWNTR